MTRVRRAAEVVCPVCGEQVAVVKGGWVEVHSRLGGSRGAVRRAVECPGSGARVAP